MITAWTIGWQEALIVILFLGGIIVLPLPGRLFARAARRTARWSHRFRAPPIAAIHEAAEAFFCSYPEGEYTLRTRERFRLTFVRGAWQVGSGGRLTPHPQAPAAERPILLRVLLQPRPDSLLITLKHEAPGGTAPAGDAREKLTAHFDRVASDFRTYLRRNFGPGRPQAAPRPARRIRTLQQHD